MAYSTIRVGFVLTEQHFPLVLSIFLSQAKGRDSMGKALKLIYLNTVCSVGFRMIKDIFRNKNYDRYVSHF